MVKNDPDITLSDSRRKVSSVVRNSSSAEFHGVYIHAKLNVYTTTKTTVALLLQTLLLSYFIP